MPRPSTRRVVHLSLTNPLASDALVRVSSSSPSIQGHLLSVAAVESLGQKRSGEKQEHVNKVDDTKQTSFLSQRLVQYRCGSLSPETRRLIKRLSERHSLDELLTMGLQAVFKRTVDFNWSLDQRDGGTSKATKTTAQDLLVLLSAIGSKRPTSFDDLIPICEVLTALIRDLSITEMLHLSDVLSSLHLHHQPLSEALAATMNHRLRLGPNPVLTSRERKKEEGDKKKRKENLMIRRGFAPSPVHQLFYFLSVFRRLLRGFATQRSKDCVLICDCCSQLVNALRVVPWKDLPSEDCVYGATQLAWIANHLAKLDRLKHPVVGSLLNENLKLLAVNGHLSIACFALWCEALLLSELDRVTVYLKTLLEIAIRLTYSLDKTPLHVLFDYPHSTRRQRHASHASGQRIGRDTHRRLLAYIYGLKYFHHDSYDLLPASTRLALERIQNVDPLPSHARNRLHIKTHLTRILRRLRVAHYINVVRGPIVVDVLERDRNCVWLCGTPTSFYTNSRERTAVHRFHQRLLQAMGYNVACVSFWQWSKLKSKRARLEYVRMARYYALRDRREFDPEFEGWSLPYLDLVSKQAYSVQSRGSYFPHFEPLGHKEY